MTLPTPYSVDHEAFTGDPDVTDEHGNMLETWAAPVAVAVHGWAPPSADTEPETGRSAVVRNLDVYAPAGVSMTPRDRVTVAGSVFEVVGHVEDFASGPWQWAAGVRINLKRFEG